jgi:hypothetical protein
VSGLPPRLRIAVLTAVSCLALALGAAPAGAAPITYVTAFQDPGADAVPDFSLEQRAIALIDATPAGERLTFAFRDFNRQPVADALIAAQARGVQVDGVIDGGERTRTAVQSLLAALGPERLVICGTPDFRWNSCIATGSERYPVSLQHNKFLTSSRLTDGREHVVLQTSENFLAPSQYAYYNDLVEIAGDTALYDAYVRYLMDLKAQVRSDDHFLIASGDDGRNTIFTSPRRQPDLDTDDTIADRLDEVDCRGGGTIRVANLAFRSERAVILRRLARLERQGCDVSVIVSNADGDILAGLVAAGIEVHPFVQRGLNGRQQVLVHDKFWLVDARSRLTGRRTKVTFAGTSNWRGDEQYSDDLLLRMIDDGVYDAYLGYWNLIRTRAVSDQARPTPAEDTTAPASVIDVGPAARHGWHRGPVHVRVAASDGHGIGAIGLARLGISWTGAERGQAEVLGEHDGYAAWEGGVSAEGVTTFTAGAVDVSGNTEVPHTSVIRIDQTPPVLMGLPQSCALWPADGDLHHVTDVNATDALSGGVRVRVRVTSDARQDARDVLVRNGSVYLRAEQRSRGRARTYRIRARAVDRAGNAAIASAACVVAPPVGAAVTGAPAPR